MLGAALLAIVSLVLVLVAALAASGRLRRNPIAGIRIPSLFASDRAWTIGHRAAVAPISLASIVCLALMVVVLVDPRRMLVGVVLQTAAILVGTLVGALLASRAARDLPAER